ncbi:MAG: sulfatase-like hydrolase/transferase, partial [Flavobacteriaceae bacterium]|nr:sulfatase-like hydrolase/transferase [Flavobacteriaceae bacterium]
MSRIFYIISFAFSCFISPYANGQNDTPNLLFIMTDQHRFDALSMAGNTVLETPNLDRLAKEGAFFTNAYTQAAVCAPARATLLTGHTIENTGLRTNELAKKATENSGIMPQITFDEVL